MMYEIFPIEKLRETISYGYSLGVSVENKVAQFLSLFCAVFLICHVFSVFHLLVQEIKVVKGLSLVA